MGHASPSRLALTLLLPFGFFAAYLHCLPPGPVWGDSADCAAAAIGLSPVHTTGYPVYVSLIAIGQKLPFGNLAFKAHVASALFAFLALLILGIIFQRLAYHGFSQFAGVFALGAAPLFWMQAVRAEVYAFNTFLHSLLLLLLLELLPQKASFRKLATLSATAGLALAHHLTTVFTLPAIVSRLLRTRKIWSVKGLAAITFGCAGPAALLFLPLRGMHGEAASGADLTYWRPFFRYVTGSQYPSQLLPVSLEAFHQSASTYLAFFSVSFPVVGMVLGLIGLYRCRTAAYRVVLWGFLCHASYALVYQVEDAYDFAMLSFLFFSFAVGCGTEGTLQWMKERMFYPKWFVGTLLVGGLVGMGGWNLLDIQDSSRPVLNFRSFTEPGGWVRYAASVVSQREPFWSDWGHGTLLWYYARAEQGLARPSQDVRWLREEELDTFPRLLAELKVDQRGWTTFRAPKQTAPFQFLPYGPLYRLERPEKKILSGGDPNLMIISLPLNGFVNVLGYSVSSLSPWGMGTTSQGRGKRLDAGAYQWFRVTWDRPQLYSRPITEALAIGLYAAEQSIPAVWQIWHPATLREAGKVFEEDYALYVPEGIPDGVYRIGFSLVSSSESPEAEVIRNAKFLGTVRVK